jgi:hypothetical protein
MGFRTAKGSRFDRAVAEISIGKEPRYRQRGEAELREVRKQVTFALFAEDEDIQKVTEGVRKASVLE